MTPEDAASRAVEAVLFASEHPMTVDEIRAHVGAEIDLRGALAALEALYAGRGIELVRRGDRWHFQTAADLAHLLRRNREESRKLSRAGIETLAIIAYHEPVTRAEIEAIRGVQISKGTIDVLMEAGWVRPAGRREVPGRPLMYATTGGFLTHFGLSSRRDLPGIDDLKAAGLLDPVDLAMEVLGESDAAEAPESETVTDDEQGAPALAIAAAARGAQIELESRRFVMGMGSIWHWLVLGLIAILLLGGGRFSNMMGDVAKGIKQFKKGMSEDEEDKPATRIEGKAAPEPTVQREAEAAREEKL